MFFCFCFVFCNFIQNEFLYILFTKLVAFNNLRQNTECLGRWIFSFGLIYMIHYWYLALICNLFFLKQLSIFKHSRKTPLWIITHEKKYESSKLEHCCWPPVCKKEKEKREKRQSNKRAAFCLCCYSISNIRNILFALSCIVYHHSHIFSLA